MIRSLLFCLMVAGATSLNAQSGDPIRSFDADDAQINAASAEAITTLPAFLEYAVAEDGTSIDAASVKVSFPVEGGTEVIWVGPFLQQSETEMMGLLANQPNFIDGYNQSDPIAFTIDMVRDWSFFGEDGRLYGHYTTRVIAPQMDSATQKQLAEVLSDDPVPATWN